MTEAALPDAPFAGNFIFEVGDTTIGTFMEVSGLAVQVEVEELVEGGNNQYKHKLPGRMTWPNIVLKRGVTSTDDLFDWLSTASGDGFAGEGNRLERRAGAITLLDAGHEPVRSWRFLGAFPVRWTGPTFAASATAVAMEELEIAHHGFTSA